MKIYYSNPSNLLSNSVKIAAAYTGETYELAKVTDDQKEEYKKNQNPSGLFPYFEHNGQGISESTAILRYIARLYPDSGLYGKSVFQSAKVDELIDFTVSQFTKFAPAAYNILGYVPLTQQEYKESAEIFKDFCRHMNGLLKNKEFLVGDSITIADIRLISNLVYPFRSMMDPGLKKDIPELISYFERLTAQDQFKTVFGATKISNRPVKAQIKKEVKKKKKEEKKQAPQKKLDKPKDPLEELKPSSMDLNAFKFWFINHADREAAFQEFVDSRFDREGWSIWDLQYIKYKGEGELLYKTNNLLNGFIQRAEGFGKYSYGVHMIYGQEPNLDLKGVWMWRGLEIPQAMIDHPQFEYYKTKKLNIDDETDRKYIKEMWLAKDGPLSDGTPIQNWKYQK